MQLDVYNTHMELYPYKKDDYPILEDMYSVEDKYAQAVIPCGYHIEDGKLYLPRGTSISKVEALCKVTATYVNESDPADKMTRNHEALYPPRNELQEDSIKFLTGSEHQLALNLTTGAGKTYCVANAATTLGEKTLIITPNETLKGQWMETFRKKFDYRERQLINIAGSGSIEAITGDMVEEGDVYFVNHATLRNYMTEKNGYALHQFFKKLRIGIKVYDESHMEFANIIMIDTFSNTNRTWYLTATFDRSDKNESKCFKRAFNSVITYGEVESKALVTKHVIYHAVTTNSRITQQQRAKLMGYPGVTSASLGNYSFMVDPNQTAYRAILSCLEKVKNVEGKTLIFIPIINAVDDVTRKLKKDWPYHSIGKFHSKVSRDEKEDALKKDIIVTTIKSCGTGTDIPGLRTIICTEQVASKVIAEQLIGRLRPWPDGRDTYFFDITDICIPVCNWWWKSRYKKIQTLVKSTVYLTLDK